MTDIDAVSEIFRNHVRTRLRNMISGASSHLKAATVERVLYEELDKIMKTRLAQEKPESAVKSSSTIAEAPTQRVNIGLDDEDSEF